MCVCACVRVCVMNYGRKAVGLRANCTMYKKQKQNTPRSRGLPTRETLRGTVKVVPETIPSLTSIVSTAIALTSRDGGRFGLVDFLMSGSPHIGVFLLAPRALLTSVGTPEVMVATPRNRVSEGVSLTVVLSSAPASVTASPPPPPAALVETIGETGGGAAGGGLQAAGGGLEAAGGGVESAGGGWRLQGGEQG
jgi:hypothetical protein